MKFVYNYPTLLRFFSKANVFPPSRMLGGEEEVGDFQGLRWREWSNSLTLVFYILCNKCQKDNLSRENSESRINLNGAVVKFVIG